MSRKDLRNGESNVLRTRNSGRQLNRRHFCLLTSCCQLKGNYKNKVKHIHTTIVFQNIRLKNVYFELFKSYLMGNMDYVLDVQSLVPSSSALPPPCNGFCRKHNGKLTHCFIALCGYLPAFELKTHPHRFHEEHQTAIKEKEKAHFILRLPELQWARSNDSTPR